MAGILKVGSSLPAALLDKDSKGKSMDRNMEGIEDGLERIRCGLIDVETEQEKTNELLTQILVELRKLNREPDHEPDPKWGEMPSLTENISTIVKDKLTWHSLYRTYGENIMGNKELLTVGQVLDLSKAEVLDCHGMGHKSYMYLKHCLREAGYDKLVGVKHWLREKG